MPEADGNQPPASAGASEGRDLLATVLSALACPASLADRMHVDGAGELPSVYAVTDLACASMAAATLAVADWRARRTGQVGTVTIDRDRASRWFQQSIDPQGWRLPPAWDDLAGDYACGDGWIRLHTNAPHHRLAALRALSLDPGRVDKPQVAAAVARWSGDALEQQVVAQGGCAAVMRTEADWAAHPQGRAVAAEPLIAIQTFDAGAAAPAGPPGAERPLAGIRVLDLTRILAGPVATRFLASYGAQVLRIDPPGWDEPSLAPEVTLGKRRARLDLRSPQGRSDFERLLSQADVLVHGYRGDALERLGLGAARRREIHPALVDVCLNAYGWTGDWRHRRGFDSLVQMSCGIADAGMQWLSRPQPTPLPVQALDHATGYLMAAAAVRGLIARLDHGQGFEARASLARTALLLQRAGARVRLARSLREMTADDHFPQTEATPWGPARRLQPAYALDAAPAFWTLPAGPLGDAAASWPSG